MGLDAVVYCDCFEMGRLATPPPVGCSLQIASDGSLLCGSDVLETQLAFDQWLMSEACEHENGVLTHHYLGNISLVGALRNELQRACHRFPMILSQVLYSGSHCGDFIAADDLSCLRNEIAELSTFQASEENMQCYLRTFASQMAELAECAARIHKPISF